MDKRQALERAHIEIGPTAAVRTCANWRAPYQVGFLVCGPGGGAKFRMLGCGLSWERAFVSLERRRSGLVRRPVRKKKPRRDRGFPQLDFFSP